MKILAAFLGSLYIALPGLGTSEAFAQENDAEALQAKLTAMPRPWDEKIHRITEDEYEENRAGFSLRIGAPFSLGRALEPGETVTPAI